ncbi:MAG TPA: SEL1-like repeat protein, partial [Vicinamibacteria bacterium]|nr:SEL1-like repeat protein [Vicinamibacteria bacterium]
GRRRKKKHKRDKAAATPAPATSRRAFALPLALALGLVLLSLLPRVQGNPTLYRSFLGAALALLAWELVLFVSLKRTGAGRSFHTMLRPQHYAQAMVQASVYAYWGYYWRPVYEFAPLLVAQLVFAYAFDILLAWSRRESYLLGFGPFPILFSTNLFLWFRDDWFYLQFVMIAVGFLGKELVRWHRDGRWTHIFNPSAFSLGLFSLALIATKASDLTWGQEIATTLSLAPRIYLFLFLVGLVVMYLFSVTLVAGSAAVTLFGLSVLYWRSTGVPYFVDSEIPSAVFLGLHLLVTDPSTSPRTTLGKGLFGTLYGLGVFGLYSLLGAIGAPTFYDKLLCVPLLNLSVKWIDGLARALETLPRLIPWARWSIGAIGNRTYMAIWILFFGVMTAIGSTDGRHPGDRLPFWQEACAKGRRNACDRLIEIESTYCRDNSAWACNELGAHYRSGTLVEADTELAWSFFSRACELRHPGACFSLLDPGGSSHPNPRILDLRLLLREGGPNLLEMPERDVLARACEHGWTFACNEGTR